MSHVIGYKCGRCGALHQGRVPHSTCRSCNGSLLAVYDIEAVKNVIDKETLARRPPAMWKYFELLPVINMDNVISLGEGYTPMVKLSNISEWIGLKNTYLKDESRNPTATFKDRPVSVTVSVLKELGVRSVAMPSAGNAGSALTAYGAKAGLEVHVAMPSDTPKAIYAESLVHGAEVILVNGLITDAAKVVADGVSRHGWLDVSTMKVPYRVEGTKTMGYEIAEQMSWDPPDVVVFPTGGGEGLVGLWKGFKELVELGWINSMPRLVAVQSKGCRPIVEAYVKGEDRVKFFEGCDTIASGIRVPKPFADVEIMNAIRECQGVAIDVSEEEIVKSVRELAVAEGILACPEGAAAYAAVKKLIDLKLVDRDEKVVLVNTGSGLKYFELLFKILNI
ncbi:MAG: threonine synthase [Zestosphaera sp.]